MGHDLALTALSDSISWQMTELQVALIANHEQHPFTELKTERATEIAALLAETTDLHTEINQLNKKSPSFMPAGILDLTHHVEWRFEKSPAQRARSLASL